jgi:hypothetical protein
MESNPRKPLRAACHCSLTLLGLLGTADARPMLLPSERFPAPGWRLRKRSGASLL